MQHTRAVDFYNTSQEVGDVHHGSLGKWRKRNMVKDFTFKTERGKTSQSERKKMAMEDIKSSPFSFTS